MGSKRWRMLDAAVVMVAIAVAWTFAHPAVKLELVPDRITTCPNVPAEIDVTWRVSRVDTVKIFTYQLGEAPHLWLAGGPTGEARTGPWIGDGTTLMITDGRGRVLARKTVESVVCPT